MTKRRSDWMAPLAVFFALSTLAVVGWRRESETVGDRAKETSLVLAASTAHQLYDLISERADALEPLSAGLVEGTIMTNEEVLNVARDLQTRHPELDGFAKLDPSGRILWSTIGHADFRPGKNLSSLATHDPAIELARTTKKPALTKIFSIISNNRTIGLVKPVVRNGKVESNLYAAMDGERLVGQTIPHQYAATHTVTVSQKPSDRLFGTGAPTESANSREVFLMGQELKVTAWPKDGLSVAVEMGEEVRRLGIYLFASLLISVMLWVALHERHLALKEADDRKSIADSLQVSEARLSDIISRSPFPIIELAKDGLIESANRAAEALMGQSVASMRTKSVLDWTHPDDRERIRPLLLTSSELNGHPHESRVVDENGHLRYIRWSRTNRYNEQGKVNGSILFGHDVTSAVEASRAQEKLIADEERVIERLWVLNDFARSLRTTLDARSLYQIAIGAATNVLANRPCAILLYDAETDMFEVGAARAASSTPPPLPQGVQFPASTTNLHEAVSEMSKSVSDDLGRLQTPHEAELARHGYVSRAVVPILLDNSCIGLLAAYSTEPGGITRDGIEFLQGIAEHLALALTSSRLYNQLKAAYTETRTAQARIVEMEKLRAVGEMTSGIAHDFNNMLMAILGYAEMLDDPDLGEERLDYVRKILTAANDAAVIVRRLQEYSRKLPESADFEALDVNMLAIDAVDLTRHKWKNQAQGRGVIIDVTKSIEPDSLMIRGNAPEIREVLTNLIFNAVDAMPDGGTITVSTGKRGNRALISVRDTGTGMSEDVKNKLFTPFYTTKGRQGNGLGLAMSYGIIRKHGGDIEVDSAPGLGTTFTLTFPVTSEAQTQAASPVDRPPLTDLKILLIDDDPDVAGAVAAILRKLSHQVTSVENGYEGLKCLKAKGFDVVVTDLGMPGMSGREVALGAKDISPNTAVILLTGWGETLREQDDTPPGVDLVLSKPVRSEELDAALRQIHRPARERAPA